MLVRQGTTSRSTSSIVPLSSSTIKTAASFGLHEIFLLSGLKFILNLQDPVTVREWIFDLYDLNFEIIQWPSNRFWISLLLTMMTMTMMMLDDGADAFIFPQINPTI
jgi:hypothetical protein